MRRLALTLLTLLTTTGCTCTWLPGVNNGGAAEVDSFLTTKAWPIDYDGATNFWFDAHGQAFAWSLQEDDTLCTFVP